MTIICGHSIMLMFVMQYILYSCNRTA